MGEKKYVVGIGEALLDVFPVANSKKVVKKLGGAPVIFAYHAAQSGWDGMVVSAVGREIGKKSIDSTGKKIIAELDNHGLNYCIATIEGKASGKVEVKMKDNDLNIPEYTIQKDDAWNYIPYTYQSDNLVESYDLTEIAKNTKAVYFSPIASNKKNSVSKKTIDLFLSRVPDDCYKLFDVNIRESIDDNGKEIKYYTPKLVKEYIKKCNVLKVNYNELEYVCKLYGITGSERKQCRELMKMEEHSHIDYLIVTLGEDGSSVYWRKDKEHKDRIAFSSLGMPVELKNTVGAGDALAGAFIGEILKGKTEVRAHHIAAQRAVIVCEAGKSMPRILQNDLFISYSRGDGDIVRWIRRKIKDENITVWIDIEKMQKGEYISKVIEQYIKNCQLFVYFSSKNSNGSEWVIKEIKIAKKNGKTIIPVKLDKEPYRKAVNKLLKDVNFINYSYSEFIKTITNLLNS